MPNVVMKSPEILLLAFFALHSCVRIVLISRKRTYMFVVPAPESNLDLELEPVWLSVLESFAPPIPAELSPDPQLLHRLLVPESEVAKH